MKTINAKISIMVYLIAGSTLFFSSYAYRSYIKFDQYQYNLNVSLYLRSYVKDLESQGKPNSKALRYLRKVKKHLEPGYRKKALSDLIQSLYANNRKLRKIRFKDFEESERKFYKETRKHIEAYKKDFKKFILLAVLSPLLGILFFSIYLKRSIVKPLQRLSQRMMDFLVDRYTFKFSHPPIDNEIGDLQRTFNSLAQRVINNMDELKALDQAKSEFVSIASHELRTPLTSIKGSLGILSNGIVGEMNEEALNLLNIAEHETDRLVRLINDLLDLAKMESNTFALNKEWLPVQTLCENTLNSLVGLAQSADVGLEIRRPEENIEAHFDKDRIQQVITNLASNAIKFSPKKAKVFVSYYINDNAQLEIGVTDQGPGIPQQDQQLIFEKFRQGAESASKLVKGTGLGLAISKALVEEHGGSINVTSQNGKGSTFYFTLPDWRSVNENPQKYGAVA